MLRRVGLLGALAVLVVATAPAGLPVQLSYVYSDSMAPTIGVDDGYVVVPAGDVEAGDVVSFRSPERGGYVTHRVVGETAGGYLTKGDNNEITDQAAGYPPVPPERIRGEVLEVGGEPLVVPQFGALIGALREHAVAVVALPLFAAGFLVLTGLLVFAAPAHELTMVAVDRSGTAVGPTAIPVGSAEPVELRIADPASPFTTRVVGADGIDVDETAINETGVTVAGTVPPPTDTGPVTVRVTVRQLPAVLPREVLAWAHERHPVAAAAAATGVVLAPLWVLYLLAADGGAPIRRTRSRWWRLLTGGFE